MQSIENGKELIEKDVEILITKADDLIHNTISKINHELIKLYWAIGKMVVEYKRKFNSNYGDSVVKSFSNELLLKYGAGFNYSNITRMIKFYELFSKVAPGQQFKNISWTHIRELLKFNDINIIKFYLKEIETKKLSKRELIEHINTKSFERTIANQKVGKINNKIEMTLKDPLILNINNKNRTEKELENLIMNNIFNFMNEIGNNITLFGRQYKIIKQGLIYKVDIVLYDKENRNFILIDLKINKVSQKDISQMKFYVDYFNHTVVDKLDNKTIGIILVETKDARVETSAEIYQVKYLNEIPKDEELLKIINENKIILLKTENLKLDKK